MTTASVAEHPAPSSDAPSHQTRTGAYPSDDEILGITDDATNSNGVIRSPPQRTKDLWPPAPQNDVQRQRPHTDPSSRTNSTPQDDTALLDGSSEGDADTSAPDMIQARADAANRTPSGRADSTPAQPLPSWLAELAGVAPESAAELNSLWQRSSALDVFDRAVYGNDAAARSELVTQLFTDDPAALRALVAVANDVLSGRAVRHNSTRGQRGNDVILSPQQRTKDLWPPAPRNEVQRQPSHTDPSGILAGYPQDDNAVNGRNADVPQFNPAAYAHFEQSTNDAVVADVSRSIERALDRALPQSVSDSARRRIASDTLAEIHTALRGDRDLSAQVAAALRNSNFDGAARDQIARLIASRARGIVPEAARRVIGEWTGSVLASHRERAVRQQNNSARVDVVGGALPQAVPRRAVKSSDIDYRATSDEDILSW
jgi:hypothetical protein